MSLIQQVKAMRWPFWVVNIMEMIERAAFYGVSSVRAVYVAQADQRGGLGFTQAQKGNIFFFWALVQCLLPVFTGGFADRYGYKRQIAFAAMLQIAGYILMATQRSYAGFLFGCLVLASGTAVFKPPIQGTMARTLDSGTSGTRWGIFYMVVNIGGFLGPPIARILRGKEGDAWPTLFYGCAFLVSLNFLWLLTYKGVESGADKTKSFWSVAVTTGREILNPRLLAFIAIMSGFWACFMQLFDTLPNFILDWIDSSSLAPYVPEWMLSENRSRGPQITQEWVINLNSFLIFIFVLPICWYVNTRMRRLVSIVLGIVIASIGLFVSGSSMSIYICFAGIAIFSLGEMLSSPKMNEYLSIIAPPGKKALYLGYANIPVAFGWAFGDKISGWVYGAIGEKATLALKYLEHELHAQTLPDRADAFRSLCETLGRTPVEVTNLLWNTYHPSLVWVPFVLAGLAAAGAMVIFNWRSKRWTDMSA